MSSADTVTIIEGVGIIAAIAGFAFFKLPIGPIGLLIIAALPWTGMYGINLIAAGSYLPALGKIIMHILFLLVSKYVYIYGTVLFPQIATLIYIFSLLIYIDPWFIFDILIAISPKFMSGAGHFRLPIAFMGMQHNIGGLSKDGGINLIVFFAIIAALAYGGANILDILPDNLKTPINSGISKVLGWTGFSALLGGGGVGFSVLWTGIQTGNLGLIQSVLPKWLGGKEGALSSGSTVPSEGIPVVAGAATLATTPPADTPTGPTASGAQAFFTNWYNASQNASGAIPWDSTIPTLTSLQDIAKNGVNTTIDVPTTVSSGDWATQVQKNTLTIIPGINAAVQATPAMAIDPFISNYLAIAQTVSTMNLVISATGAALAGGGIQHFAHTMLNTPASPTLSTIMKGLNTPQQQGGGSAKKEDTIDDSLFLSILGLITIGGMVTAVLRSMPNRQPS